MFSVTKTPSQKWKEDIESYRRKCQRILQVSQSIRYVGLINEYGRTLTGIIRPDTTILLKSSPARNEFFLMSTLLSMRRQNSSAIGEMEYGIFKHRKLTLIIFQRNEGTYYISVGKNTSLNSILKIMGIIKKII